MLSPLSPAVLQAFFTQLDMRYQLGYQQRQTYWQYFAERTVSGTERKTYSWLAELPGMRKWIGEKQLLNIAARAYEVVNDDFENTFAIDRNKIEDDQADIYGMNAQLQGDVVKRWPDDVVTTALLAGTSTLCYDGQYFFDTDHPVDLDDAGQGVYSNLLSAKPLNATNYAFAKAQMRSYRGESGKPLQVLPTILMVPPALEQAGKQIVLGDNITQIVQNVAGAENVAAAAPTNVYRGDTTLVVNERLVDDPDANAWYMFSTDRIKPLIWQVRKEATRIQVIDPSAPMVFNNRQLAYSVEGRAAAGFSLPFLAIKAKAT